jgi:hypothetical protein
MTRITFVRWTAVALAAFALTSQHPSAYVLKSVRWNFSPVPYYVNTANLDLAPAAVLPAVQYGAAAWTNQSNAAFSFYYAGSTSGATATNNGKNEVFFRNASNGSAIATTYTYSSGGRIVDTDIVFWDAAFKFFAGSSGCSGGLYVEDIATHEFGHALGLGHSSVSGATMYPSISYCSTSARTLSTDDQQGVEAQYPTAVASNTPPDVQITSPASGTSTSEGAAVGFAATALDAEDGNIAASLIWTSSRDGEIGRGSAFQRVLSVGTHTITARVSDSYGAADSSQTAVTVNATPAATPASGLWVTAKGYKVKGLQKVDLAWGGVDWVSVDIYRDGTRIVTTVVRSYTDAIDRKGSGSYAYVVCQAGTGTCSQARSVVY